MAYIPGQNSKAIALELYNRNRRKEEYERKTNNYLKELGKNSAFIEEFENIKLDAQELPVIENVEDITQNEHFLAGRKFGFALIGNGFDIEKYNQYKIGKETKKHR